MSSLLRALSRGIVENPRWVVAIWVVVVALLIPSTRLAEERLGVAVRIEDSESGAVAKDLALRFHSPYVNRVLLVLKGLPGPDTREGREALQEIVGTIRSTRGVAGVLSYLDAPDRVFVGALGGSFVIVGLDPRHPRPDALIPGLREVTQGLTARLRRSNPGAELMWTGEIPLNFDLRRVSAKDARAAEIKILPITLLLLLFAFGSLVAALLPVTVGVVAILLTLGTSALLARHWQLSILVQNLASMLGLGLGIDYALLMVSRFRESSGAGRPPLQAAEESLRRAGHTLMLAALPVSIGFAALLTVPVNELFSVGIAGILVTAFSLLLSLTFLPACLAWLGPRLDAGRFFFSRIAEARSERASERWRHWSNRVTSRPKTTLALAGGALLLLAGQAFRLNPGLPRGNWLPPEPESVRALDHLDRNGRSNVVHALRLVVDLPVTASVWSRDGWTAIARLSERLEKDPRIERVHSLPVLARGNFAVLDFIPAHVRDSLATADGRGNLIEALPESTLSPNDQMKLVRDLRATNAAELTGLSGSAMRIGGLPAFNADYEGAIIGRFVPVLSLVVTATLVALFVGFRSVLVAVKAVALNLLSVGAAFGALVLVFQEGYGARLLGLDGPTGGVFPIVPVLVFCIVFGLSMDYEVILVARVAEARRAGFGETAAIAEGFVRTGPVITSAAAIMVVVFAAFTLGGFLLMKMLGFALAVAVLLDATLVRFVIGPALLRLAGEWNWWPRRLGTAG